MPASPPVQIRLTSHRQSWWMLFPAAAIALVSAAAYLASALPSDALPVAVAEDWAVPAAGIGGIVVVVLLIWVATIAVDRAVERRRALRVLDTTLARWPQYASEAQWRQAIEKEDRPTVDRLEVVVPVGIVAAVALVIAVPLGLRGLWPGVFGLGAFCLVAAGLMVGRRWNAERERRADQRRRQRLRPYPSCWLAAEALYHEDWGLVILDRLTEVRIVRPDEVPGTRKRILAAASAGDVDVKLDPLDTRLGRAGWSLLQLTIDQRVVRTWTHRLQQLLRKPGTPYVMPVSVRFVRVPPGREQEAEQVRTAMHHRWLADQPDRRPAAQHHPT